MNQWSLTPLIFLVAVSPLIAQSREDSPPASLSEEVRELRRETSNIRNQLEVLNHRLNTLIDQLDVDVEESVVRRVDLQMVPAESVANVAKVPPPARQTTARSSIPQKTGAQSAIAKPPVLDVSPVQKQFAWADRSPATSAKERQAYLDALVHLERGASNGSYRRLRRALQHFVKTHPGGVHEPAARYLIAESYYTEKKYQQAAQSFLRYIENFPGDERIDDAWLKLADIYYEQGEVAAAMRLFRRLSDSHNDLVRKLAQRKLQLIAKDVDR